MFGIFMPLFKKVRSLRFNNVTNSKILYIENLYLESGQDLDGLSFKTIIKSDLSSSDRLKFIGRLTDKPNLVNRTFSDSEKSEDPSFFLIPPDESFQKTLKEVIEEKARVVLLGNPGLGKSTELEQLAIDLWNDQETEIIPIHKNLRNFTANDNLESFTGINWRALNSVIYLLDGIDEISDIQNFVAKLETFISKIQVNEINCRFLISCRTNVYVEEVKNIAEFDKYYLKNLTWDQGINLLKKECDLDITGETFNRNFESFIKNPYLVRIASKYINETGKIPSNTAELWKRYVKTRLKDDSVFKFLRRELNSTIIKSFSKNLALINELMKRSTFTDNDLLKITNDDLAIYKELKKSPLFDAIAGNENKFFEHRNVQEYFAALKLLELDSKGIIEFIQIEDSVKTHPSLFNTITFLINLIPITSAKFNDVIDWIVSNEPELLFRSDTERIDEKIRISVFQSYFKKECIEKTLWIDSRRVYEVDKIAIFADVEENFDFLLQLIKDKDRHFRVRLSALEVLSRFELRPNKAKLLQEYFLSELPSESLEIGIKCQILKFFNSHTTLKKQKLLLEKVFEIFKEEKNKQINSSLLDLLENLEEIDDYSEYLNQEFQRANDLIPRGDNDEVLRGNRYKVHRLILEYKDSENFILPAKYYFNNDTRRNNITNDQEEISEKCIFFVNQNEQFLFDLLNAIDDDLRFHTHRNLLFNIINKTNKQDIVVKHLLENWRIDQITPLLARILRKSNVRKVIEKFKEEELLDKDYEGFRNRIANTNTIDLATHFERLSLEDSIQFNKKLFSQEDRDIQRNIFFDTIQSNLDILFNTKSLLFEMKIIFDEGDGSMNWDLYHEIDRKWYEENGHHNTRVNSSMDMIQELISNRTESINYKEIISTVEKDFIRLKKVKEFIENCKNHSWEYNLYADQRKAVEKWCQITASNLDFNDVIILSDNRKTYSYASNKNFLKIELIHFFQDLLKFKLPKEFLLGCIEFDHLISPDGQLEISFDYLNGKINNVSAFNEKVIENINNKELWSWAFSKHLTYAIDNKLEETYPVIRDYFVMDDSEHPEVEKLEQFVKLTHDIKLLIECCSGTNRKSSWAAIKILMKLNKEEDLCVSQSLKYLRSGNKEYVTDALWTLFKSNKVEAIEYIVAAVETMEATEELISMRHFEYNNYSSINNYAILGTLFELIYNKKFDEFDRSDYRTFLATYSANIIEDNDEAFKEVQEVFNNIKVKLTAQGKDLFHINFLIDDIKTKYYLSKSKTYEFKQALNYVNQM